MKKTSERAAELLDKAIKLRGKSKELRDEARRAIIDPKGDKMAATLYIFRCSTERGYFLATDKSELPAGARSFCSGEWLPFTGYVANGVNVNGFPADEMLIHAIENSGKGYCTFRAGFTTKATAKE